MALKKTLMIAGAVTSIGIAGATAGMHMVSAESNGGDTLVDKIAQKFSLNKNDVQAVFDQQKGEMKAEHKAKMEARLSQAVSEGKLTEDQKAKIIAKFEELDANRPSLQEIKTENPDQIRQGKLERHDDLEQWAKDNGIPEEYIHFGPVVRFERMP